jgi:hypothetical protein
MDKTSLSASWIFPTGSFSASSFPASSFSASSFSASSYDDQVSTLLLGAKQTIVPYDVEADTRLRIGEYTTEPTQHR